MAIFHCYVRLGGCQRFPVMEVLLKMDDFHQMWSIMLGTSILFPAFSCIFMKYQHCQLVVLFPYQWVSLLSSINPVKQMYVRMGLFAVQTGPENPAMSAQRAFLSKGILKRTSLLD